MTASVIEIVAAILFAGAILHTFSVHYFRHRAHAYPAGSVRSNLFHALGEVEIAFGLWAAILLLIMTLIAGKHSALAYLDGRDFTEPMFVFVIMTIAATQPVIRFALAAISSLARLLPLPTSAAFYFACLCVGPLLGSLITEPAAMTVTALLLKDRFLDRELPLSFKYATLGLLFVNVSIGGVLTHFAAPPVLMVASTWDWGIAHMWMHFGWKATVAVVLNTALVTFVFYRTVARLPEDVPTQRVSVPVPAWLIAIYLLFLVFVVLAAHHAVVFIGFFLLFLGVTAITEKYQEALRLRDSLLVAFFLAGLVVLGGLQAWWLAPLIRTLDAAALFAGTTALTAFTDNAAITYLGSQIVGVSDSFKYLLVAGAVAGGGMTVIANAPNPAGFAILQSSFGEDGISPLMLALAALIPTIIAMACFWWLPTV